jgi:hypothetical protein
MCESGTWTKGRAIQGIFAWITKCSAESSRSDIEMRSMPTYETSATPTFGFGVKPMPWSSIFSPRKSRSRRLRRASV